MYVAHSGDTLHCMTKCHALTRSALLLGLPTSHTRSVVCAPALFKGKSQRCTIC